MQAVYENEMKNIMFYRMDKDPKCRCEKMRTSGKIYSVCDICSEKEFLRKSSSPILFDSSTFSEE